MLRIKTIGSGVTQSDDAAAGACESAAFAFDSAADVGGGNVVDGLSTPVDWEMLDAAATGDNRRPPAAVAGTFGDRLRPPPSGDQLY